MPRGGNNRKPRALKKRQGTLQPCRDNPRAPKVEPGKVPPPQKGMTAIQKAVWRELATQAETLGAYAPSHFTAFRLMVEAVAETRRPDPRDPPTVRSRNRQIASALLQRFGLDPVSQERVSVPVKPDDDTHQFLFGEQPLKVIDGGGGSVA